MTKNDKLTQHLLFFLLSVVFTLLALVEIIVGYRKQDCTVYLSLFQAECVIFIFALAGLLIFAIAKKMRNRLIIIMLSLMLLSALVGMIESFPNIFGHQTPMHWTEGRFTFPGIVRDYLCTRPNYPDKLPVTEDLVSTIFLPEILVSFALFILSGIMMLTHIGKKNETAKSGGAEEK